VSVEGNDGRAATGAVYYDEMVRLAGGKREFRGIRGIGGSRAMGAEIGHGASVSFHAGLSRFKSI
jgi:hypothetical protein